MDEDGECPDGVITFWQEEGGTNINIYNRTPGDVRVHFRSAETNVKTSLKAFAHKLRRQKSFNGRIRVGDQLIVWGEKYYFTMDDDFITRESSNKTRKLSWEDLAPKVQGNSGPDRSSSPNAWAKPTANQGILAVSAGDDRAMPMPPRSRRLQASMAVDHELPPPMEDLIAEIGLLCRLHRYDFGFIIRRGGRIVVHNTR
jgi:hypothetical protein